MTSATVWAPMLGMDGQATMGYDPAGRRDRLTIASPSGTRTSYFFTSLRKNARPDGEPLRTLPGRACSENTVAEFSGLWDVSALLRRFIYAPGASFARSGRSRRFTPGPFLVVERATGAKKF